MKSSLVATVLLVLFIAVPAIAQQQPRPSPFFIDGAVFAGFERRAHTDVPSPYSSIVPPLDPSETVAGGGFGVGTFLSPRVSLRVEAAFPATLTLDYSLALPVALARGAKYRGIGAAVLVGVHTARRRRVALGYLGGLVFLRERQESPVLITTGPPTSPLPFPINVSVDSVTAHTYRLAAQVGVDADIAVAPHFSLVPQVRVQALTGALSVRPGIALRWAM